MKKVNVVSGVIDHGCDEWPANKAKCNLCGAVLGNNGKQVPGSDLGRSKWGHLQEF
jgi:hypothetical protein